MEYENCISETSRVVNTGKINYNLDSSYPKYKKDFELPQESRFQEMCCKIKLEPPSPMKADKSVVAVITNNSVDIELLAREGCDIEGGKGGSDISLSVVKRNGNTSSPVPSFIVLYDDPLSALKAEEKDVTINTELQTMSTQDDKGSARRIKMLSAEKKKCIWSEGCLFYKKKCVDKLECYDNNLVFKSVENSPSVNLDKIVKKEKGNIKTTIFFTSNGIDGENAQAIKPIIDPIEHDFFDSIEQNLNNSRDSLQKGFSWDDSYTSFNSQEYSYCDARSNVVSSSPLPEPNWSVWKTPPELRVHPHSQTKQVNHVTAHSKPKHTGIDFLKQKFNILATKGKSVAARYGLVNSFTGNEETMVSHDSSWDSEILAEKEQHSWSYVSFKENIDYESGFENIADSGSLKEFDLFDFFDDIPEVEDEFGEKNTLDYSSVSVKCEIHRCKWKGFCYELCSHVLGNHNDSDIMSDVNQVKKVYNATQLLITKKKTSLTSLAIDKGELFWFTFATRPRLQKCYFIARLIGERSKADRYSVDVFLKRVLNSSVQQYSCPMGCVGDTIRQLIKSEQCIAIPQKQMAMFTDNYGHEILFQLSIEEG